MSNSFSILFYPKQRPSDSIDSAVLYTRITYIGKRSEFSTSRRIDTKYWNARSGKAKGNSDESKSINRFLDSIKPNYMIYMID